MGAPVQPGGRGRRWARRVALASGLLALLACLSVLLAGALLATPQGNAWLRHRGRVMVGRLLPGAELELGRLRTDLVRSVVLEEAWLVGDDGSRLVGFEKLEATWRPADLLHGELHVERVVLRGLHADIAVDPGGRVDLLQALGLAGQDEEPSGEPWEGLPVDLRIDRLHLVQGRLDARLYQAEGEPTLLALSELEAAAGLEMVGPELWVERVVLSGQLGHGSGTVLHSWLPLGLGGGVALESGGPRGADLLLQDSRLRLGSALLGVQGVVQGLQQPRLDLSLALRQLDPAELAFLTGELPLSGQYELELTALGPLDALELRGTVLAPAGNLRLGLGANLLAQPATWTVQAALDSIEPQRFVQGLARPWWLQGSLSADGSGLSWPAEILAEGLLQLEPGQAEGIPFQGVDLRFQLRDGLLLLPELALDSALGVGVLGGRVDPAAPSARLEFHLEEVPLEQLAALGVPDLAGQGQADGVLALAAGPAGLVGDIQGVLAVSRARYGAELRARELGGPVRVGFGGGAVEASGELDARGVLSYGAALGRVRGPWELRVAPDGGLGWRAELEATGIQLGALEAGGLRTTVQGELPVAESLQLEARFDASMLQAPSVIAPDLVADKAQGLLRLEGDRLEADLLARQGERDVLLTRLQWDLARGELELPTLLLAPSTDLRWEAASPVRARLAQGGLRGVQLRLRSGTAELSVQGDLDLQEVIDLRVVASDVTLDPLVPVFPGLPRGLSGRTRLVLQVGGSGSALTVDGFAEVDDLVLPGTLRHLDARLALQGDGRRLAFQLRLPESPFVPGPESLQPAVEMGAEEMPTFIWAEGSLPLALAASGATLDQDAPWDMDLLLAPGSLRRFHRSLELEELPVARLSARLTLAGSPARPSLALGAALEAPVGEDDELVRLDLDLEQQGEQLLVDARLSQHMQRQAVIRGSAATQLPEVLRTQILALAGQLEAGAGPELGSVRTWADDLQLSLVPLGISVGVLDRLVDLPEGLRGELVGGVQVSGSPLQPTVAGALQLAEAELGGLELAPALLTVLPAGEGYDLQLALGFADLGALDVSGHLPLQLDLEDPELLERALAKDGLVLGVSGDGVPLGALAGVVGQLEDAQGLLRLEGELRGSLLRPEPELNLSLHDGSFTLSELGVRCEDLSLQASLDGSRLTLDRLRAATSPAYGASDPFDRQNPVALDIRGSAELTDWRLQDVDLRGQADRLWLVDTQRYRLNLSGDFTVAGGWPALKVRGDVAINEAWVSADDAMWLYSGTLRLDPMIRIRRDLEDPFLRVAPVQSSWTDQLDVQLDLDLQRHTTVQVEMPLDDTFGALYASLASILLEARLDGLLQVSFQQGELSLLGEVEPVWGRADIFGARFSLDSGTVSFVGDDPFDPILQIPAVHDAGLYGEVAVDISGSLDELGLEFRSEEYLDETDVAAILVLGRPMSELSGGEGESNAQLLAIASSVLFGELERQGSSGRFFDMFELGAGGVKGGWALGDDVFLTVGYNPNAEVEEGENITEATVDWRISPAWSTEFVTGDQGTSSADLYWTWRF